MKTRYPRHCGDGVDAALTERCRGAGGGFSIDALVDLWRSLGRDIAELGCGNNGNKRMTAGILIRSAIARGDMTLEDLRGRQRLRALPSRIDIAREDFA